MRYKRMYVVLLGFAAFLLVFGVLIDEPGNILSGLWTIMTSEDALITDYIQIAGVGAAFVNAALVTLISILILYLAKKPMNGYTIVEISLMAGFSLFGKNIVNIWPIILGTFLYARVRRERFRTYASVSLLATSLAPVVSYVGLDNGWGNLAMGVLIGVLIGFVLPPISAYTYKIQNGMNLYNMGFACGLLALILVPLMRALGADVDTVYYWATGHNRMLGIALAVLCGIFVIAGLFFSQLPARTAWTYYCRLLQTTGRAPSDYLRMLGPAPVLINMGVNGLVGTGVILLIGGDLNGPTVGGILTLIGFSAFGKHVRNILPVMAGVLLGGLVLHQGFSEGNVQLAVLFGTTLAPVSGCFGWPFGILAGFLHSAVVLYAGSPVSGLNLYNNGFSGGLIALVLYPVLTSAVRHNKIEIQEEDYFDAFWGDCPLKLRRRDSEEE